MNESGTGRASFVASAEDFEDRIRNAGWGFWRGFVLGASAVATITYPVVANVLG